MWKSRNIINKDGKEKFHFTMYETDGIIMLTIFNCNLKNIDGTHLEFTKMSNSYASSVLHSTFFFFIKTALQALMVYVVVNEKTRSKM